MYFFVHLVFYFAGWLLAGLVYRVASQPLNNFDNLNKQIICKPVRNGITLIDVFTFTSKRPSI